MFLLVHRPFLNRKYTEREAEFLLDFVPALN